jgi:hypothetical protein
MDGLLCEIVCDGIHCAVAADGTLAAGTHVCYPDRIIHPMYAIRQAVFVCPAKNPRPPTPFALPYLPRYNAFITTRAKEPAHARIHAPLSHRLGI